MEHVGAISARAWSSLNGIYSSEADLHDNQFMASHDSLLADHYAIDQNYHQFTIGASSLGYPLPIFSTYGGSTSRFSPRIFFDSYSSYRTISHRSTSNNPNDHPVTLVKGNSSPLALSEGDIVMRNSDLFVNIKGGHHNQFLNQELVGNGNYGGNNQFAMSHNVTIHEEYSPTENGSRYSRNNYIKRSRSTPLSPAEYGQGPKNKRNVKTRETSTQELAMSDNEIDEDIFAKGPISPNSSFSAGEHSNASHEEHGGIASSSVPKGSPALNLNGKTRAARGSATDPQSVYARKRREKINEKLKTLQNLVPNGTKVDISTMLEEAVRYVKFLQLQIKLLSSDDLWIYAPLAYTGMDIGLDHLRFEALMGC